MKWFAENWDALLTVINLVGLLIIGKTHKNPK